MNIFNTLFVWFLNFVLVEDSRIIKHCFDREIPEPLKIALAESVVFESSAKTSLGSQLPNYQTGRQIKA